MIWSSFGSIQRPSKEPKNKFARLNNAFLFFRVAQTVLNALFCQKFTDHYAIFDAYFGPAYTYKIL